MSRDATQPDSFPGPADASWAGAPDYLNDGDVQRLRKLFQRTIGRGFKMAFVETPTQRDADEVLDWLRPHFAEADAKEYLVHLPTLLGPTTEDRRLRTTVWNALTQTIPVGEVSGERAVIVVRGIEDLLYIDQQNRFDLLQQFNVQRDLFVRDYPCFWLLLVHPRSRHHWYQVAPDFSDFVALWIEASTPEPATSVTRTVDLSPDVRSTGSVGFTPEDWPELLRQAFDSISLSRYDEALDQIHTFLASVGDGPDTDRDTAIARMLETDVWGIRGENQRALERLRNEVLPVFERLGTDRERAVCHGRIADVLQARGELDEALRIRREEELPVYERLGDVREKAVTSRKIADILNDRGELDEALRMYREEALAPIQGMGLVADEAVFHGLIADVLQARGELNEALRIRREEQLPVYERLGDVRGKAVTQGKIADVLQDRGKFNDALRILRNEVLPAYERLGAKRELAVGRANTAVVLLNRNRTGDQREAITLLKKAVAAAEEMGIPEERSFRELLKKVDPAAQANSKGKSKRRTKQKRRGK